MLKLSQNIIDDLKSRKVEKVKIYFYNSWCSGTKIGIVEDDFEVTTELVIIPLLDKERLGEVFDTYTEKKDEDKFKNAIITKVEVADHTWNKKVRYIYNSNEVKNRCGCGSSFSFEKKLPRLNLEKLKWLKNNF